MKLTTLETVFCGEEAAVRTLLAIKKSHPEDIHLRTIIHTDALPQELLAELDQASIAHYHLSQLIENVAVAAGPDP